MTSYMSIHMSMHMSVHMPVYISILMCIHMPIHTSIHMPTPMSTAHVYPPRGSAMGRRRPLDLLHLRNLLLHLRYSYSIFRLHLGYFILGVLFRSHFQAHFESDSSKLGSFFWAYLRRGQQAALRRMPVMFVLYLRC